MDDSENWLEILLAHIPQCAKHPRTRSWSAASSWVRMHEGASVRAGALAHVRGRACACSWARASACSPTIRWNLRAYSFGGTADIPLRCCAAQRQ
eukprot:1487797-Pleurochrysis_carterae.AAC.1